MAEGSNVSEISEEETIVFPVDNGGRGSASLEPPMIRGWAGYQDEVGPWWYKDIPPEGNYVLARGVLPPLDEDDVPPSPRNRPPTTLDPWRGMDEVVLPRAMPAVSEVSVSSAWVPPPPAPWKVYNAQSRCAWVGHGGRRFQHSMTEWRGKYYCGLRGHQESTLSPLRSALCMAT